MLHKYKIIVRQQRSDKSDKTYVLRKAVFLLPHTINNTNQSSSTVLSLHVQPFEISFLMKCSRYCKPFPCLHISCLTFYHSNPIQYPSTVFYHKYSLCVYFLDRIPIIPFRLCYLFHLLQILLSNLSFICFYMKSARFKIPKHLYPLSPTYITGIKKAPFSFSVCYKKPKLHYSYINL